MATTVLDGRLVGDAAGGTERRYDAIVVGSGHNGLIAAGYLAKAGKRVLVLERRDIIGGATVTEEPWPGCKLSTCSYVCNLLMPEVIADLELRKYGYDVRPFDPQYFVPLPGWPVLHVPLGWAGDAQADRQVFEEGRHRLRRLLGDVGPDHRPDAAVAAPRRRRPGARSKRRSTVRRGWKTGGP